MDILGFSLSGNDVVTTGTAALVGEGEDRLLIFDGVNHALHLLPEFRDGASGQVIALQAPIGWAPETSVIGGDAVLIGSATAKDEADEASPLAQVVLIRLPATGSSFSVKNDPDYGSWTMEFDGSTLRGSRDAAPVG